MSNIIIGTAVNYFIEDISPFLNSLHNNFNGELFLLTNQEKTKKNKKRYSFNIRYFDYEESEKENPVKFNSVNNSRLFWYLKIVEQLAENDNVLLTDVRDVFFQSDPFVNLNRDLILVAREDQYLRNCPYNSDWILSLYGEEYYNKIRDNFIYCSGTILGSKKEIQKTLEFMVSDLISRGVNLDTGDNIKILDQGIFNYYVYENPNRCIINDNQNGTIYTMGYSDKFVCKTNGRISNFNNIDYAIVHQYDRFKWLTEHVYKNFKETNKRWFI